MAEDDEKEEILERLCKIPGVGEGRAEVLYEAGIESPSDVVEQGMSGLGRISQIGFRTAKKIYDSSKRYIEEADESDEELDELLEEVEDLDESVSAEVEEEGGEELTDELKELEDSLGEVEGGSEDATDKGDEEDLEEVEDGIDEELEALEELESSLSEEEESEEFEVEEELKEKPPKDVTEQEPKEEVEPEEINVDETETEEIGTGIETELEGILSSIEGEEESEMDVEPLPDMDTAKEIDRWLEEKVGIEQHIGEESICPVCGSVVSIYDERCDTCGVEFAQGQVRCDYCGALIEADMVSCPECGKSLVDEKTKCPICKGIVYASEDTCPFCGAEFTEDEVRCSECKSKVPMDSVICPNCETILREKIIEEEKATAGTGSMEVQSEKTEVDVRNIELQLDSSGPGGESSGVSSGTQTKTGSERVRYPFPAIVGQEKMKRSLLLNAVNSNIGGVLIEGQRGTAKSVAVRGLAEILPDIDVVSDCRFSCDPYDPDSWCWECRDKYADAEEIPVETRPVRVIDLPLNATEDRVVGTIDVEKMLSEGTKAFEEGILAEVNRGILYVDEINLLDDYIVDVLLDAAAMGVVTVEREEISLTYPSNFIIIGSMNPEEGALRPQLLDRLALNVKVEGIPEPEDRVKIINRNEEFSEDPHGFRDKYREDMEELRQKIIDARDRLPDVTIGSDMDDVIARLSVDFEVDGHRADLIMKRTARTNAAFEGRTEVSQDDLMMAAEMALPHRMRKGPLEESEFSTERLKRLVRQYT